MPPRSNASRLPLLSPRCTLPTRPNASVHWTLCLRTASALLPQRPVRPTPTEKFVTTRRGKCCKFEHQFSMSASRTSMEGICLALRDTGLSAKIDWALQVRPLCEHCASRSPHYRVSSSLRIPKAGPTSLSRLGLIFKLRK